MSDVELVLASNSPRRRELLALGGWHFHVQAANVDETPQPGESPQAYVLRLAVQKAYAVATSLAPSPTLPQMKTFGGEGWIASTGRTVVIAADTTVVDGEELLGKPADELEAVSMLRRLRGRVHQVYTALAVLDMAAHRLVQELAETEVPMRLYTDDEIQAYVASGDPLDKAGAYAIQHRGFHPVAALHGCFANVMGLPLCHLVRVLRSLGIHPAADVPQACQARLEYACPVYENILAVNEQRTTNGCPEK